MVPIKKKNFHVRNPNSRLSDINFKVKKHTILENHLNHQVNIILRNFAYYEMFCEVFFFSFTNLS